MNFFKMLKGWFSSKKEVDLVEKTLPPKGEVRVLMEMPYNVVHPGDLMEPLLMAISTRTLQPVGANVTDIKLYSLYDRDDNTFIGSFYALERDGGFYGNLVGSSKICFLEKDAFKYKKTEELVVPLENKAGKRLVLICVYKRRKASLTVSCLMKADENGGQNGEILHDFEKGTSFDDAYAFYQETMKD